MNKSMEEKRSHPRVKTALKLSVLDRISADAANISEGGLSFNATETISSPRITLHVQFPGKEFELKAGARLVWQRDILSGGSSYGVEFIQLEEAQKAALRKALIKAQIKGLLDEVNDEKAKEDITRFFLKDLLEYTFEIGRLITQMAKQEAYSSEIEASFTHLNNQILLKGYCLEEIIENESVTGKNKDLFRFLVGTWAYKSPILKKAFEQSRGYPGDYEMLETIYDNSPIARGGIALCFDKYFLSSPYAVAVRSRKDKLREIIQAEVRNSPQGGSGIKILNIACGSCRELRELPSEIFTGKNVSLICLDADLQALEFSKQALKGALSSAKINFIHRDIKELIKEADLNLFEKQDIAYSPGFIDYLPDKALKAFVEYFYACLKERGKLILTHKNKEKTFSLLSPDWFCNWKFVERSKDEVVHLFYDSGIKKFSLSVESDAFNDIYYYTITRI
ncbi:MAG: PilZ domain-containing protein [Candidatus Omnitrophota bacterium]